MASSCWSIFCINFVFRQRDTKPSCELYLAGNNKLISCPRLTDSDASLISEWLQENKYIVALDLRYNNFTDVGAKHIAELITVLVFLAYRIKMKIVVLDEINELLMSPEKLFVLKYFQIYHELHSFEAISFLLMMSICCFIWYSVLLILCVTTYINFISVCFL